MLRAAEANAAYPSPKVSSDVSTVMQYYDQVGTTELADEFYQELRRSIIEAAKRPESFAVLERDIRRVNLHRFPYHFLFRVVGETVRILVVRHHKRDPKLGIRRR